jgi:hypothetical protein
MINKVIQKRGAPMSKYPDVEQLAKKTRKYEFADGLRDLQFGLYFIFYGLVGWIGFQPIWMRLVIDLKAHVGEWAVYAIVLSVFLIPVFVVYGMLRLMRFIRERWLWRNSGYVEPSTWPLTLRNSFISASVLVVVLGGGLLVTRSMDLDVYFPWRLVWVAVNCATAVTFINVGRYLDLKRYTWLGIICGVVLTPLLFIPMAFIGTMLVFSLVWGIALLVSGLFVFRQSWQLVGKEASSG